MKGAAVLFRRARNLENCSFSAICLSPFGVTQTVNLTVTPGAPLYSEPAQHGEPDAARWSSPVNQ